MLSALQVLLHSHSGQEDMLVGVPVANRASAELENVIGPFVNTVVIRTRVSEATTFAEVLESVRRAALDAFARQELPFDKLVAELAPRRSSDRHPIFQIMFV
ncbi:MAG: hypothetical protein GWO21_12100, partial [Gammaproteobacteria bacterium]|nr:hypothetical protein [Gammaproteobacteria bacterium]